MTHFDLISLRLFTSVCSHGNIAQASRDNNIAASAISKRISDLEARMGTPLIHRLKDGVKPTPAGLTVVRYAERVLALLQDMDLEMEAFTDGARGEVRLWANTSAVTQFLPEDLTLFTHQRPDVSIELREETSSRIVEALRGGLADIGIFSEHVGATGLNTILYRRDTLMAVVPRGHVLEGQKSVRLEELACYDLVGLQDGSSLQNKLVSEAGNVDIDLKLKVKVLSFDGIRRMVEARVGLAVLPAGAILPYIDAGLLSAVTLDEPWATRSLMLAYKDVQPLSAATRTLLACLAPDADPAYGLPALAVANREG